MIDQNLRSSRNSFINQPLKNLRRRSWEIPKSSIMGYTLQPKASAELSKWSREHLSVAWWAHSAQTPHLGWTRWRVARSICQSAQLRTSHLCEMLMRLYTVEARRGARRRRRLESTILIRKFSHAKATVSTLSGHCDWPGDSQISFWIVYALHWAF